MDQHSESNRTATRHTRARYRHSLTPWIATTSRRRRRYSDSFGWKRLLALALRFVRSPFMHEFIISTSHTPHNVRSSCKRAWTVHKTHTHTCGHMCRPYARAPYSRHASCFANLLLIEIIHSTPNDRGQPVQPANACEARRRRRRHASTLEHQIWHDWRAHRAMPLPPPSSSSSSPLLSCSMCCMQSYMFAIYIVNIQSAQSYRNDDNGRNRFVLFVANLGLYQITLRVSL